MFINRGGDEPDPELHEMPTLEKAAEAMKSSDFNGDGVIDYKEFCKRYARLIVSGDEPSQIHLALTQDPSEMVVMWSSPDNVSIPVVQVGTKSGVYDVGTFSGTNRGYSVNHLNETYTSLPIHDVHVKGLKSSTHYFYRCGNGTMWSEELNFTTAPPLYSFPPKVSWAVYGDMGTVVPLGFEVTDWLLRENYEDPFDLILHVGDLAYAGVSSREFEVVWDDWMNQIQPLASIVPYQTSVGNHEGYYNFTSYMTRFDMPGNMSVGEFWWSMDYGNVHLTSMSNSNDYSPGSPQYTWLEQDLAAAYQRSLQSPNPSFIILNCHRPFLCSDSGEYDQHCPGAPLISTIEPLMLQYHVDLTLTGHMHCYERTYPTINGTTNSIPGSNNYTNPTEPIHIVQGTAGAWIGERWINPEPIWSAFRKMEYGYGRMEITTAMDSTGKNSTTLHYVFKGSTTGEIVDQLWVTKTK